MIRLAADENFRGTIVRGLLRHAPSLDIVRVQDVGLAGADDPAILQWAAENHRVLLTHDEATMVRFAYERVEQGLAMSGVLEVRLSVPVARVIEEVLLLAECSLDSEWEGQVRYLPL